MIKLTNTKNIDFIIAHWLMNSTYSGGGVGKKISATSLLRSTQQQYLNFKINNNLEDSTLDISYFLTSKIGTAIHEAIQKSWEDPKLKAQGLQALGLDINNYLVNTDPIGLDLINDFCAALAILAALLEYFLSIALRSFLSLTLFLTN